MCTEIDFILCECGRNLDLNDNDLMHVEFMA